MIIDTLEILMTADASGIESTLKSALQIVQGTVNNINSEEVDWTSIFTRAISPAIISGVASMFAFAIEQATQFQSAMTQTGAAVGDSTAQIGQLSQSALSMSTQLPQSAVDLGTAMAQVGTVFGKGSQATNDIVQAMAEVATVMDEPLSDVVGSSMQLFKEWGVTTESGAIQTLTDLMHGAQATGESVSTLASQFSAATSQLPASDRNLTAINGDLASFSSLVLTIGPDQAATIFKELSASASTAGGPLEQVGINFNKIQQALSSGNLVGLLTEAVQKIQALGTTGATAVLGSGVYAAFTSLGQVLPTFASDETLVAKNGESIKTVYDDSDTSLRELTKDWNTFVADVIGVGSLFDPFTLAAAKAVGAFLLEFGSTIADITKDINDGDWGDLILKEFKVGAEFLETGILGPIGQIAPLLNAALGGGIISKAESAIQAVFGDLFGSSNGKLSNALAGAGTNFSSSQISAIDTQAGSQDMITSLISALQTGIKGTQYASLVNTFHLSVPAGSQGLTAQMIASQLYKQFQGTTQ